MSRLRDSADDCLVALLKEGSREAFDEIYHRYHAALYRNVFRLVKDQLTTEDLVQDSFLAFWQKRNDIDATRSLPGWLFVISYHLSINRLRRQAVEAKALSELAAVAANTSEEVAGVYEEQMAIIEKAILQLPPQKRRVLELCKLEGRSYKAASQEMNISTHTVKEYLTIAMRSVRKYAASGYKFGLILLVGGGF